MGDVLVTSDMTVVRLPDLAWIADQHRLNVMPAHVYGTVAAPDAHSTKLYNNYSWTGRWRIYYCAWPMPGTPKVATTDDPTGGAWTTQTLTIPALETWEAAAYGIGSLCLVRTPGGVGSEWKAYYQYQTGTGDYTTGRMDTVDGLTFTAKQQVTFDATLDGYSVVGITSAIWDEVQQKIIATAHVSASGSRLYGAILESTDGLSFTTTSLMIDPGLDHYDSNTGDMFDLHWISRVGSVYTVMWTTNRNATIMQAGIGVSTDLVNWYIPPRLTWTASSFRYPSSAYVQGRHYVVGVNAAGTGITVVDIPPAT